VRGKKFSDGQLGKKSKRSCLLISKKKKKSTILLASKSESKIKKIKKTTPTSSSPSRILEREARERLRHPVKPATSLHIAPATIKLPESRNEEDAKWLFDIDTTSSRQEPRQKRRHAAPPRSPITNFESLPNECDEYEEKIVENIETKQKELQYPLYIPLAAPILLRYGTAVNDDVI